jgi:hypothetical protein
LTAIAVVARPTATGPKAVAAVAQTSPGPMSAPGATPTSPVAALSARSWASMALFPPSGSIVLFGGLTSFGVNSQPQVSSETWTWDGQSWHRLHPVLSPPARYGASLVYDPINKVLVLYGGTHSQDGLNDTWTWDGANWKQMSPPESPPAWRYPAMTYDVTRKAAVLYLGGMLCPCVSPDQTWSWDGSTWSQIPTRTIPDPDRGSTGAVLGTIAYYPATGQTLYVASNGTWKLDAGGWVRLGGGGAVIRSDRLGFIESAVAYDEARGLLLEFGSNGDTWTWDGSAWTAQNPSLAPPARGGEGLAYDAARKRVVLFGGADFAIGGSNWAGMGDTWIWDGSSWKQIG